MKLSIYLWALILISLMLSQILLPFGLKKLSLLSGCLALACVILLTLAETIKIYSQFKNHTK